MAANFQPLTFFPSYSIYSQRSHFYTTASYIPSTNRHAAFRTIFKTIPCRSILRAKRTGNRRYPSEKRRLEKMTKTIIQTKIKNKDGGFWRFSKLAVPVHKDPGKEFIGVSIPLLESIAKVIEFPLANMLPMEAFTVVRKSFDARKFLKDPQFVYTVDMDVKKLLNLEPHAWDYIMRLKPKLGYTEYMRARDVLPDLISILQKLRNSQHCTKLDEERNDSTIKSLSSSLVSSRPRVAVVGSGPSGLFASLVLGELGANVTLIERGEAVEQRGRDIGALVVRRALQPESNFCFGEGGAGTWSDGKLVTRIGRNSDSVHAIMKTLVQFGAPPEILLDGKPHLGTDRLIRILRNFRQHLVRLGVDIKFGTRLDDLIVENRQIIGIKVSDSRVEDKSTQSLLFDAVVLAVGHSARDVYQMLLQHNVDIVPKDFAVGLRIEHPQELINKIQYSSFAPEVQFGRGKIPVADYKVVQYVTEGDENLNPCSEDISRSCYSFCMCPGGQVVLTSTNFSEISINGMSFSRRSSRWANAAIVVTVSANDFASFRDHGPLCGVEFQKHYERKAAMMGGGNFVVPAQTLTDFLDNKLSVTSLPQSSYRLGVKPSNLHELLPAHITKALQHSLVAFDRKLPGYISKDALLHGVETRTSAPVQILRNPESYESTSLRGLYPAGEGAGHAGGIVSAAVDGIHCGFALAKSLNLFDGDAKLVLGNAQKKADFLKY